MPGIRAPSVTWGLLSSVVLTRYLRSLIGVEDIRSVWGELLRQCAVCSVQCAGRGETRPSGMSRVLA